MVKSMTGFGRGQVLKANRKCIIEIRTVNSKYLDIQVKTPRLLYGIENDIRKKVSSFVKRGKADVFVSYEDFSEGSKEVLCDIPLALEYKKALDEISLAIYGEDDETTASSGEKISSSFLARFNDVLTVNIKAQDDQGLLDFINPALEQALSALTAMRIDEGKSLVLQVEENLSELGDRVDFVAGLADSLAPALAERLSEKIKEFSQALLSEADLNHKDLTSEIALYADKCSIDEEITRMRSHLSQFGGILKEDGPIGKKMDFLVQEMLRETNTIGSKANDGRVTSAVVEMKTLIEKIREQIQNIE